MIDRLRAGVRTILQAVALSMLSTMAFAQSFDWAF